MLNADAKDIGGDPNPAFCPRRGVSDKGASAMVSVACEDVQGRRSSHQGISIEDSEGVDCQALRADDDDQDADDDGHELSGPSSVERRKLCRYPYLGVTGTYTDASGHQGNYTDAC